MREVKGAQRSRQQETRLCSAWHPTLISTFNRLPGRTRSSGSAAVFPVRQPDCAYLSARPREGVRNSECGHRVTRPSHRTERARRTQIDSGICGSLGHLKTDARLPGRERGCERRRGRWRREAAQAQDKVHRHLEAHGARASTAGREDWAGPVGRSQGALPIPRWWRTRSGRDRKSVV